MSIDLVISGVFILFVFRLWIQHRKEIKMIEAELASAKRLDFLMAKVVSGTLTEKERIECRALLVEHKMADVIPLFDQFTLSNTFISVDKSC